MTSPAFESFLARLLVEAETRARFLDAPRSTARAAGLNDAECDALAAADLEGLRLAAESLARKRAHLAHAQRPWWRRWRTVVR